MFFIPWDHEDWKQSLVVVSYVSIGIAGIIYAALTTESPSAFLSGMADAGGALFLLALVTEGVVWTMVMALGKIREARNKGREEGRAEGRAEGLAEGREEGLAEGREEGLAEGREEEYVAMMEALRASGMSEPDIQRVLDRRNAQRNGSARG